MQLWIFFFLTDRFLLVEPSDPTYHPSAVQLPSQPNYHPSNVPQPSYHPAPESFLSPVDLEDFPPQPQAGQREEVDIDRHSRSSSPSSIYSLPHEEDPRLVSQLEGVLREETATPSETRREQGGSSGTSQSKIQGQNQVDGEGSKEDKKTVEEEEGLQNDINSEPEMANDSSGEEEDLGEDEETLVETLCRKMEQSRSGESVADVSEQDARSVAVNARLAELRKLLLRELLKQLECVEKVGGMRGITYLQVSILEGVLLEGFIWTHSESESDIHLVRLNAEPFTIGVSVDFVCPWLLSQVIMNQTVWSSPAVVVKTGNLETI